MRLMEAGLDYKLIYELIEPGARVLDLGCGNGDLLALLVNEKGVKGQGIELNEEAIYQCVEKGLSVFHSDIDSGLSEYPDKSFDYVILNQSLQQVKRAELVLDEALRVGNKVIVGFPNFGHFDSRFMLFFRGKAPVTVSLPHRWFDTPNLRCLSVSDFRDLCSRKNIKILKMWGLGSKGIVPFWRNMFALNALFLITK